MKFGGETDGVFNAAGFSSVVAEVCGTKTVLDGKVVRALLVGRKDVEMMPDGSYFKMKS
jgi:hypothetical protein